MKRKKEERKKKTLVRRFDFIDVKLNFDEASAFIYLFIRSSGVLKNKLSFFFLLRFSLCKMGKHFEINKCRNTEKITGIRILKNATLS